MISMKIPLILAICSFIIGKLVFSVDYFNQCVATDKALFENQKLLNELIDNNQTLFEAIEDDNRFYTQMSKYSLDHQFPKFVEVFKEKYKVYLNAYEGMLQGYENVFFCGYFKIADEGMDGLLEAFWKRHEKQKEFLSISFKDKNTYFLALQNIQIQNSIGKIILNLH